MVEKEEETNFKLKLESEFIKTVTGKTANEVLNDYTLMELISLSGYMIFIKSAI